MRIRRTLVGRVVNTSSPSLESSIIIGRLGDALSEAARESDNFFEGVRDSDLMDPGTGVWDATWPEECDINFGGIVDEDGVDDDDGGSTLLRFSGVADIEIGGVPDRERFCAARFINVVDNLQRRRIYSHHPKILHCRNNCRGIIYPLHGDPCRTHMWLRHRCD